MRYLKRHALRLALSLAIVVLFALNTVGVVDLAMVSRVENFAYDQRIRWTMPNTQDKRIVIVDIDEKSLQDLGHWPWGRDVLAGLMDQLFDHYKIDTLGFDVVFAEADNSSGLSALATLGQTTLRDNPGYQDALSKLKTSLDYDARFANSLKNRQVALGYYFRHQQGQVGSTGQLPPPLFAKGAFNPAAVGAVQADAFTANLTSLQTSALAGGFFNASPLVDADGVFRRVSLIQQHDGQLYETLALAVARLALRESQVKLNYADGQENYFALESMQLGPRRIPVDIDVGALIPYRGRAGSYPYVSATDVLKGKVPPAVLNGAIVLVGTTAPGLQDLRSAPVGEVYPGVEAHANLLAGILDGTIKERPAYTLGLELLLLVVSGLVLALVLPALSPLWSTAVGVSFMGAWLAANLYAWQQGNLVLPLAPLLLMMDAQYLFAMAYGFFIESRGKRQLSGLFGQYVPPELVGEMAKDPGAYSLAGESRELTVLFSDVRGFTTISEGLSPTELTDLMNQYLSPMTKVIHHHKGTIDKYMGDAIMAFWGAPVADKQHAEHAVQAALDMIADLKNLQAGFKARGWPPVLIGVGLSTGEMTVGNMGSSFRMAYTVMGDAVNLGARLEGLTRVYGVDIIVSEVTKNQAPTFVYRELDRVRVKGKNLPVVIFEPICAIGHEDTSRDEELRLYDQALAAYRQQDWGTAQTALVTLQALCPEHELYPMYAQRVDYLQQNPPGADWDGAFTFKTK